VSVRARRAGAWLVLAGLCAAVPAGAGGFMGSGSEPGRWVGEAVLSSEERREFEERRAALEARANALTDRVSSCGDPRSLVRENLAGVQHVRAVEVGLILLTSDPPKMPVTFAIALGSGRVVWDRLTVTVSVRPSIVPLGGPGDRAALPCGPTGR
jgi:hypothetical protein